MAVETPGAFIQAGSYSAEVTRRAIFSSALRGATIGSVIGGLVASTDLQVTGLASMNVEVSAGEIIVPGSSVSTQSGYYGRGSSATTLAIAASDPTNPRIDRISAIIKDKAYTGAEDTFSLAVETGTPTAEATLANLKGEAAAPASSVTLAHLLVPAKATITENANIKNVAALAVPGLQSATYREGTAANRPAAAVKGRIYYATDTHAFSQDTGSEWLPIPTVTSNTLEAKVERTTGTEYEPSASRATLVKVLVELAAATKEVFIKVEVGGKLGDEQTWKMQTETFAVGSIFSLGPVLVPAGVKWKPTVTAGVGTPKIFSIYQPL